MRIWSMNEILLRGDYPYREKLREKFSVSILPRCVYVGSPSAVVLDSATPVEILDELHAMKDSGISAHLVAVEDMGTEALLISAFPEVRLIFRSADTARDIEKALLSEERREGIIHFTERETALLHQLSYGMSNKELSIRLGISERSVRRIKTGIYRKTGLLCSEQLAIFSTVRISTRSC